jgi:hypothetical protein
VNTDNQQVAAVVGQPRSAEQHVDPTGNPVEEVSDNPLNDGHYAALNSILERNAKHKNLLARMRKAGLEFPLLDEQAKATGDLAAGIKREFFPRRP